MLHEKYGDLLSVRKGILCHQVNYHGAMGGGVAAAIADQILTESEYASYVDYCRKRGRAALGSVQFMGTAPLVVANMFCQDEILARSNTGNKFCITDYERMRECFERVRDMARVLGLPVYIPRNIGCGIAGGDWERVKQIIQEIFENNDRVTATIVARKEAGK